ncbi:MAG: hypothetical protein R3C53_24670 [Pirellulaceae bacterium]
MHIRALEIFLFVLVQLAVHRNGLAQDSISLINTRFEPGAKLFNCVYSSPKRLHICMEGPAKNSVQICTIENNEVKTTEPFDLGEDNFWHATLVYRDENLHVLIDSSLSVVTGAELHNRRRLRVATLRGNKLVVSSNFVITVKSPQSRSVLYGGVASLSAIEQCGSRATIFSTSPAGDETVVLSLDTLQASAFTPENQLLVIAADKIGIIQDQNAILVEAPIFSLDERIRVVCSRLVGELLAMVVEKGSELEDNFQTLVVVNIRSKEFSVTSLRTASSVLVVDLLPTSLSRVLLLERNRRTHQLSIRFPETPGMNARRVKVSVPQDCLLMNPRFVVGGSEILVYSSQMIKL